MFNDGWFWYPAFEYIAAIINFTQKIARKVWVKQRAVSHFCSSEEGFAGVFKIHSPCTLKPWSSKLLQTSKRMPPRIHRYWWRVSNGCIWQSVHRRLTVISSIDVVPLFVPTQRAVRPVRACRIGACGAMVCERRERQ